MLKGVDFDIKAGQTVALVGPSGGGKSTMLRCINGLHSFDEVEILVGPHTLRPDAPMTAVPPMVLIPAGELLMGKADAGHLSPPELCHALLDHPKIKTVFSTVTIVFTITELSNKQP